MRKPKTLTKTAMRRELAYLERMAEGPGGLTKVELDRWCELVRELVGKPSKAEMRAYRKQWIEWKRSMNRLREAGCLDPDTDEPIFEKSV